MPPLNTHLVIGERLFPTLPLDEATYGDFLLGGLIADVNSFGALDRRDTHLVGRIDEDGEAAYTQSCANFLRRRETLLRYPWDALDAGERAFVAGYFGHLAADETWKAIDARYRREHNIRSWREVPVPADVFLTAFSVESQPHYRDFDAVAAALRPIEAVPDLFTHVPHADVTWMWRAIKPALLAPYTAASYFDILARKGVSLEQLRAVRAEHARYWDAAFTLIADRGGVAAFLAEAVAHAAATLPALFAVARC